MTTITNKKQYPSEQYLNELITNIEFAARAPVEVVSAMAAELQKRREADSAEPVAYIFKHPAGKLFWALTDESNKEQADVIPVYAAPPVPVVSEEKPMPNPLKMYAVDDVAAIAEVRGWNAYRAAMLQSQGEGNPHVTPARLPGGFTIEDAKVLHEDLVRSHISQALSGEKMKKKDRDADLRWIHGVIVQAAWFIKASLEQNALSGNSPVIPGEVLSAIREVARIRADFDDFDGDRRGIGDCLDEAEQELIVTINKYASQLAVEPVVPDDVLEQTVASPALGNQVSELTMWVKRLVSQLKKAQPDCKLPEKAMDYLKRNGLISVEDVLR